MSRNYPKFWIYAVVDGKSRGLYVKKKKTSHSEFQNIYFYLKDGLQPTEEIGMACEYNDILLYPEDDREERILNEIISYAVNVALHGKIGNFEFTQKYAESRGYQEVVDRYYEDDRYSPFKEFFESAATLKKHVLRNIRGKRHLAEGMAEEFGMLSPHNLLIRNFLYLKHIHHVLKIGEDWQPEWFRKQGPIAADFEDGRIYRRKERLAELKELVLSEPFCLLEGLAATGKTVLVHQLGYELFLQEKLAVYYFNFDWKRDFSEEKLAQEINNVKGVIILENIHLENRKCQFLRRYITEDSHRHVLFTGRPSCLLVVQELKELDNYITLIPFDQVDEMINLYVSHFPKLPWSEEVCNAIKSKLAKSLWLISYALMGYPLCNGQGKSEDWVEAGVKKDLRDLELLNPTFPEILVALSPLYQREVLTAESYLRENLRFEIVELNALVVMGEITRQDSQDGHVLYGLPHVGLARVYWQHGFKYRERRKIPRWERFVYDYCICDVPNGLLAAVKSDPIGALIEGDDEMFIGGFFVEEWVLAQLDDDKTVEVFAREKSLDAITTVMWRMRCCAESRLGCLIKTGRLLPILAEKIVTCDSLMDAAWCLWQVYGISRRAASELARYSLERVGQVKAQRMSNNYLDKFRKLLKEFRKKKYLKTFPWKNWPLDN